MWIIIIKTWVKIVIIIIQNKVDYKLTTLIEIQNSRKKKQIFSGNLKYAIKKIKNLRTIFTPKPTSKFTVASFNLSRGGDQGRLGAYMFSPAKQKHTRNALSSNYPFLDDCKFLFISEQYHTYSFLSLKDKLI